jgi:phage gp16-like protein
MSQRSLGLDDDTYRSFLESVTGKRSTTKMTVKQRWKVVEELKRKGMRFDPKPKVKEKDADQDQGDQSLLARHLWLKLKGYGQLRESSEWALLSYVERITGRKRLEWCSSAQITKVIETLKKWVERVENNLVHLAVVDGLLPPKPAGPFENIQDMLAQLGPWRKLKDAYLAAYKPPRKAA